MAFNKKGNVDMIQAGVLVIVMAGFLLIMGLILLDELLLDTADTTTVVLNESEAAVGNITAEVCANTGACGMHSFTIINMSNGSDTFVVATTDYVVTNQRTCEWMLTTAGAINTTINESNMNVTYSYKSSTSEACLATNDTIFGMGKFADYLDLIVLAIVISVIISLLVLILTRKSVR